MSFSIAGPVQQLRLTAHLCSQPCVGPAENTAGMGTVLALPSLDSQAIPPVTVQSEQGLGQGAPRPPDSPLGGMLRFPGGGTPELSPQDEQGVRKQGEGIHASKAWDLELQRADPAVDLAETELGMESGYNGVGPAHSWSLIDPSSSSDLLS